MVKKILPIKKKGLKDQGIKRKINGLTVDTGEFKRLYPFTPHFITLDDHKLHYLDQGKGSPVMMVHGNPTWSFYFRTLVRDLSKNHKIAAIIGDGSLTAGLAFEALNHAGQLDKDMIIMKHEVEYVIDSKMVISSS